MLAGTAALVLSSVSVGLGLMMGGRLLKGRVADRRALHEALGIAVMVAVAIHALALIGDSYLRPSLLDVTVLLAAAPALLALSARAYDALSPRESCGVMNPQLHDHARMSAGS
jgi:hypothetical protein